MSGWYWSTTEESFGRDGPFDSRAEAVADAERELLGQGRPGTRFWTCRRRDPKPDDFAVHGDYVVEQLGLDAYDRAGEWAEGWPDVTEAEEAELGEALTKVMREWLQRHSLMGTWWEAVDLEQHTVPPGGGS